MGEDAALRGDREALDQVVEEVEQAAQGGDGIGGRIEADHRIAAAIGQPSTMAAVMPAASSVG